MSSRGARMALAVAAATFAPFVWGGFSHMILIRGVGYAPIPDERGFPREEARVAFKDVD